MKFGKKEFEPLNHGEILLHETDNGYMYHRGDGNVKYRSNADHEQEVKSREFVEPPPRKPLTLGQTLGHE